MCLSREGKLAATCGDSQSAYTLTALNECLRCFMSKRVIPSKAKKQTVTTNYSLRSKSGSVTLQEDSGIMDNTEKAYSMDIEPNDDDVLHTTNNANPTNADIMTLLRSMNSKLKKLDTIEADITGLKKDIASVNSEISDIDDRVKTLEDNENSAIHRYNEALKRHQISALNNEYNSKEYNVIIYNRPGVGKKETPVPWNFRHGLLYRNGLSTLKIRGNNVEADFSFFICACNILSLS